MYFLKAINKINWIQNDICDDNDLSWGDESANKHAKFQKYFRILRITEVRERAIILIKRLKYQLELRRGDWSFSNEAPLHITESKPSEDRMQCPNNTYLANWTSRSTREQIPSPIRVFSLSSSYTRWRTKKIAGMWGKRRVEESRLRFCEKSSSFTLELSNAVKHKDLFRRWDSTLWW